MTPTSLRLLLILGFAGTMLGWIVSLGVESVDSRSVPVPWMAAATLAILAIALWLWTSGVRSRLARAPGTKPLPPLVAARSAALALATSRVGAVVSGFYVGLLLVLVNRLDVPAIRVSALWSALSALCAVALTAIAWWLERILRLPDEPPGAAKL